MGKYWIKNCSVVLSVSNSNKVERCKKKSIKNYIESTGFRQIIKFLLISVKIQKMNFNLKCTLYTKK